MDGQELFDHVQALPEAEREAAHQAILAEIARRRRVRALAKAPAVQALINLALHLREAAEDPNVRDLFDETAGAAQLAFDAMRDALAETPD